MFKVTNIIHPQAAYSIDYFGATVMVPLGSRITYVATDGDGEVYGFCKKPCLDHGIGSDIWTNDSTSHSCTYLCKIQYEGDWKNSLLEINRGDLLNIQLNT